MDVRTALRRGYRALVTVALFGLWGQARAADGIVKMDATASYRNYGFEAAWAKDSQHMLEESLEAQFDSHIIDRAIASYRLGFALDHRNNWNDQGSGANLFGYRYDGQMEIWSDGTVPVRLWAARQSMDTFQQKVPLSHSNSQTLGYSIALAQRRLPRIQSRGFMQDLYTGRANVGGDGAMNERHLRNTDLVGELMHVQNRFVARGSIEQRRHMLPEEDRVREMRRSDIYADYSLDESASLLARSQSRSYLLDGPEGTMHMEQQSSDAVYRWRPSRKVNSSSFYRLRRGAYSGTRSSDSTVGTNWSYWPIESVATGLSAGVTDSWVELEEDDVDEKFRFLAQHAQGLVSQGLAGRAGAYRVNANGGVASVNEIGAGWGVQTGAGGGGSVSHDIGGIARINAGTTVGRQWDSSPRAMEYLSYGWTTGLSTRQLRGASLQLDATNSIIQQLSSDEGNSDRFRSTATTQFQLGALASVGYSMSVYRDVLDDEYANGLGHAARVTTSPFPALSLGATYFYSIYGHSIESEDGVLEPNSLWSHRLDAGVNYQIRVMNVQARYSRAHMGGRVTPTLSQYLWVELSRSFWWTL